MYFAKKCKLCGMWHVVSYSTSRYRMDNDQLTQDAKCCLEGGKWRKAFLTKKTAEQWRMAHERGSTNTDRVRSDFIRRRA